MTDVKESTESHKPSPKKCSLFTSLNCTIAVITDGLQQC